MWHHLSRYVASSVALRGIMSQNTVAATAANVVVVVVLVVVFSQH
jgi:hypothetical protein